MLEVIAIIWLILSVVCGFGFAWFTAFLVLDFPIIQKWATIPVFILVFIILGIILSIAAMILLPVVIWEGFMKLL